MKECTIKSKCIRKHTARKRVCEVLSCGTTAEPSHACMPRKAVTLATASGMLLEIDSAKVSSFSVSPCVAKR